MNNFLKLRTLDATLIPVAIGLNLSIAFIVTTLKLPIYLDAVGTIFATLLLGLAPGIITGTFSFLIGGMIFNPVLPYFVGTQIAIAVFVHFAQKVGGYNSYKSTIISGMLLGVVAGLVSAPVIVILFGGMTGSGRSIISAFLISTGKKVLESVVLTGLLSEPIDKTLQSLLAFWLYASLPDSLKKQLSKNV